MGLNTRQRTQVASFFTGAAVTVFAVLILVPPVADPRMLVARIVLIAALMNMAVRVERNGGGGE